MKRFTPLAKGLALSLVVALGLVGCGGGGASSGTDSNPNPNPTALGRVRFKVAWPDPTRGVLDRADRLEIVLRDSDSEAHTASLEKPETECVLDSLPVGAYSVNVEAYRGEDVIGRASTEGTVTADETDQATVTLEALLGSVNVVIEDSE